MHGAHARVDPPTAGCGIFRIAIRGFGELRVRSSARNVEIVHRDVPRASHWRRKNELPVLGPISAITTQADRPRRRWRMPLAARASVVGLVLIVGVAYVVAHHDAVISLLTRTGS